MSLRGFSYRRTMERRDRLFQHALRPYVGTTLLGNVVADLRNDLLKELPQTVSADALYESLRIVVGLHITHSAAKELAWRIAGNIPRLNDGQSIHPWVSQVADEVVPFRIERVRPDRRRNTNGYTMSCRAVAGTPCPLVFPIFFSSRECAAVSSAFGFSGPYGSYPYTTAWHYMGLLFFGAVDAAKSDTTLRLSGVTGNTSLTAENKPKIAVRTRNRPCPRGFAHECVKCWLGANECPAAVWPTTLITRQCSECHADGYFEPDDAGTACLNCRGKPQEVTE